MREDKISEKKIVALQLFEKLNSLIGEIPVKNVITLCSYCPDEDIYIDKKEALQIFYVQSGVVKIVRTEQTEIEPLVRLVSDKNFIGFLSLIKGYEYSSTATAVTDVEAYKIDRDFLESKIKEQLEISVLFSRYLLETLFEAESKIKDLLIKNTHERLATILLNLYKNENGMHQVNIIKKDLAQIAGTTKEKINQNLDEIASKGLIRFKGKKIILADLMGLIELGRIVS